jgi:hypothetical protein
MQAGYTLNINEDSHPSLTAIAVASVVGQTGNAV